MSTFEEQLQESLAEYTPYTDRWGDEAGPREDIGAAIGSLDQFLGEESTPPGCMTLGFFSLWLQRYYERTYGPLD